LRENSFLAELRKILATGDVSVKVGCGPDDCAHLEADGRRLAASTDALAEGVHVAPDAPPGEVAYKSLAASVSDLAASACRARWALVSLALSREAAPDWAVRFAEGLAGAAAELEVAVVGGDTISSSRGIFVSVTVLGEPLAGGPILRSGARPGDLLVVTGALGGSLLGRHLHPRPRSREIRLLMDFCREFTPGRFPSAGLDISDGLALDLSRLCRESGVGAELYADCLPLSPDALKAAEQSGQTPLWHALSDGEDFELLLSLPPAVWEEFRRRPAGSAGFTAVGKITGDGRLVLREADGRSHPLEIRGYEHQW
jgi:thiamine-monophosphate kinase